MGEWDITGEGLQVVTDELDAVGIEFQKVQMEVLQQDADTREKNADENIRHNDAQEKAATADRALAASTSAMSAYLQGTQLADARRLAAHQEARALLPSLVSPDREFFAGTEPGGFLDRFSQKFLGGSTKGVEVVKKTFRPGDLAAGAAAIEANVAL